MNKRLLLAGSGLGARARAHASAAFSQVKPEILVKQRQAAMTLQGKYAGPLGAMAQGKAPTTPTRSRSTPPCSTR